MTNKVADASTPSTVGLIAKAIDTNSPVIQATRTKRPEPLLLENPSVWGTHKGVASGRDFFAHRIGIPIRHLSTSGVKVTDKGITVVKKHLARFELDELNKARLERLKTISEGALEPSTIDLNFYTHELREFVRYRKLGYELGQPADPWDAHLLWSNTHSATLEDYGLSDSSLYD